tara:strand:- start:203 stop:511 length:309 start_codon:yes stop_codon:yes gene_type:complete
MEKITIDREEFYYKEMEYCNGYYVSFKETRFYKYEGVKKVKKHYGFFELRSKWVEEDVYTYVFTLNFYITDPRKTKEDVKKAIYAIIGSKQRRDEIAKGEII